MICLVGGNYQNATLRANCCRWLRSFTTDLPGGDVTRAASVGVVKRPVCRLSRDLDVVIVAVGTVQGRRLGSSTGSERRGQARPPRRRAVTDPLTPHLAAVERRRLLRSERVLHDEVLQERSEIHRIIGGRRGRHFTLNKMHKHNIRRHAVHDNTTTTTSGYLNFSHRVPNVHQVW